MTPMNRRHLLASALALPLGLSALSRAAAGEERGSSRTLILLELAGGNDGLNSVVPYSNPAYYRSRPKLAVQRDRVLQVDESLGLNPALEPLMAAWEAGDLAAVLGVGYPRPNRSHFRSIEIWNTASASDETLQDGWLDRAVTEAGGLPPGLGELGVVLGGPAGPLAGTALTTLVMKDQRQLKAAAPLLDGKGAHSPNPALDHILAVRRQAQAASGRIEARLAAAAPLKTNFPKTALGRQLQLAATLIASAAPAAVIKVQQGGYDTHAGQAGQHPRLLGDLAASLSAFRRALLEAGAWRRCLVMTYAEFGRRVQENASGGTDHGTAAPHLLMGGPVSGGLYGRQPSLGDLEGGDLRHSVDFRQLYATAAQGFLGLPAGPGVFAGHRPLAVFA